MMKDEVVNLNRPQLNVVLNIPRTKKGTHIWGRGTGKSSVIAFLMDRITQSMPRSNWAIQGATFQQLLTRTLPGTLAFLEKLGYRRDKEVFINKVPPGKHILMPHQDSLIPENTIYLLDRYKRYATGFSLFSQDRSSSRGPSRDGVIVDEALLIDREKFAVETLGTLRGNRQYYGDNPMHHGEYYFSSRPLGDHWLHKHGMYLYNIYDFRSIQNKIADLQYEFCVSKNRKEQLELWQEIDALSYKLKYPVSKSSRLYTEYSAFDNIENLGWNYIKTQLENMPPFMFKIEILNKLVTQIQNSFYPLLSREKHGYKGSYNYTFLDNLDYDFEKIGDINSLHDLDCDKDLPLDVGLDFGTGINWWIVGQEIRAPFFQFNFIKEIFVKSPRNIDDAAKEFCNYYRYHKRKLINLWPDGEGNIKRPNAPGQETYVNQIQRILIANGWIVNVMKNERYNTSNKDTYMTYARCLAETNSNFPRLRFNLINCKYLVYSMEQTPAKDYGHNDIRKDKSSEKRLITNREEATDAGDAADQIIQGKYGRLSTVNTTVTTPLL